MKKWGVRATLLILKGLVGIKKLLTFLVFSVISKPAGFVWARVAWPVMTFAYVQYRRVRRFALFLYEPVRGRLLHLVTGRHAVKATVLALAMLVFATNISANEFAQPGDAVTHNGILVASSMLPGEDAYVIEETADAVTAVPEVSYLGSSALSIRDHYPAESESESAEIADGPYDDAVVVSHIANAVRAGSFAPADNASGPTRTSTIEYVVQDGESPGSIASKFGLATSTILWANNLSGSSVIRPGQTLKILPVDGISYVVKKGDTVAQLARKYDVSAVSILDINGLSEAMSLRVGELLVLPGAKPPAPPRPAPKPAPAPSTGIVFVPPASSDSASTKGFVWPAGVRRITQYFNWRHSGLDIAGPMRTPVYAAADGTVIFSGWNSGGYGNMIILDHGGGVYTRYAHATRNLMKVGDKAARGDVIQLMGSTGRSTGPHLHFEVMEGNIYNRVNPFNYVE